VATSFFLNFHYFFLDRRLCRDPVATNSNYLKNKATKI